ncbi:electron transport complex subunit RsxC [Clostridium estertheticum]|uniref:Ion-translocating oxidoreductase complex subunit C n=1 Tax=Clostridium estertheticum subsp. estertheticum TaxID=1552 RepID=A0A1J0GFG2_9CLOT|nr:electron transport complex subunit RsxC [Clostridium estertheticum]APC39712.1 electron transporter RnfC [Clostridium estertheticum subsp. estertheticum]MBU3075961.1 electron transport complex subunit RsxC [Clostridium estertheticum]MBU3166082.1 electron transport complex subunit RsxC [Clostridium estertheticum]MBU3174347.1 electron transport complex subunit RsxC [Clostridium estertheticum]MBU3185117.1 electron transport complex subunit RsxC [Clostridium estertheticum]
MIKSFRGGIHPNGSKNYTASKPIEIATLPSKVVIPVSQHIGAPCVPTVAKGDYVKKGQVIATSPAFVSSPVHASISGMVKDIALYPHPVFGKCLSIVIENDGKDEWIEGIPLVRDWEKLSADEIKGIIKDAGIVGMGGATFPTFVKLSPPKDKKIDTFILNAAECEPFLTADHRMMLEHSDKIAIGVKLVMKVLGVEKAFVGIEDNKPDAVIAMQKAFEGTTVKVMAIPTKYPQGAEKMLIKVLVDREVPSGSLPMDVGVVVQNVGTVVAICDAVVSGIPLIERVTTISGSAVKEPKNLLLRIGTTFEEAIENCGGFKEPPAKIIMGGPMMGFAQSNLNISIIKGVSGILGLTKKDINNGTQSPCIRCGKCVSVCPCGLNPSMLSILGERDMYEEAKLEQNLFDCAECGSCVYVCPAKRNIVQYIKYSKMRNNADAAKKKEALAK